MKNFDWSDLDAHLLRLLVTVVETGSVTGAAQRLGVTQSAVSHLLDKLRAIVGDPLFVKSGRGIVATARAEALAPQARELLAALEHFARAGAFEPARWHVTLTIAANDLQRDVLLPPLLARLRQQAPGVDLRVIPSGIPSLDMLRQDHCQIAISPRPPEGTDILQKRLFQDTYRVFYDPQVRPAPKTLDDYLQAEHVTVVYESQRLLDVDQWMIARGVRRRFRVMVPGFAGVPAFLRGSDLLATAPSMLSAHLLRGLAHAPVPASCPPLPMYLIWHRKHQADPAHRWLRGELEAVAAVYANPARQADSSVSTSRRACSL